MNTEKFKGKYRIPSARWAGWDYGSNAAYFVTICIDDRAHWFGDIVDGAWFYPIWGGSRQNVGAPSLTISRLWCWMGLW